MEIYSNRKYPNYKPATLSRHPPKSSVEWNAVVSGSLHLARTAFRLYFECAVRTRESKRITIAHRPSVTTRDRTVCLGCDRCVAPRFIDLATRSPMSLHYISFITLSMPQRGNAIVLSRVARSAAVRPSWLDAFAHVESSRRLSIIGCIIVRVYKLDWFSFLFIFVARCLALEFLRESCARVRENNLTVQN